MTRDDLDQLRERSERWLTEFGHHDDAGALALRQAHKSVLRLIDALVQTRDEQQINKRRWRNEALAMVDRARDDTAARVAAWLRLGLPNDLMHVADGVERGAWMED